MGAEPGACLRLSTVKQGARDMEQRNRLVTVLSVQVPSKETGSPGFNVTAGPATQSEVFVHTAALSVSKLVAKSVLWEAYPNS